MTGSYQLAAAIGRAAQAYHAAVHQACYVRDADGQLLPGLLAHVRTTGTALARLLVERGGAPEAVRDSLRAGVTRALLASGAEPDRAAAVHSVVDQVLGAVLLAD